MMDCVKRWTARRVGALVHTVRDFPKRGIVFRDLTPVLADAAAFSWCGAWLGARVAAWHGEVVAGIEARGFAFGALAAERASVGLALVRKPGKLPRRTVRTSYALEYGSGELEAHAADFVGRRVVVVDDVLATGGTAAAAAELVEKAGGKVAGFAFVLRIAGLGGEKRLGRRWSAVLTV